MHRPFVVGFRARLRPVPVEGLGDSLGFGGACCRRGVLEKVDGRRRQSFVDDYWWFRIGHRRTYERRRFGAGEQRCIGRGRPGLLAPRRRHFCLLILVVRVAGGAACLLHLVFNHRDDRMIRDAALARTVVVQNVTEPNPALLHELPRSDAFRVG
jgi:hypothetical protein